MAQSAYRTTGMRARGVPARVLGVAWLATALACGNSPETSAQARSGGEGERASAVLHKVQVNAQQAAELEKRGAKVLADYGSFKLMHLEESVLSTLPAEAGVELRDDYNNILLNAGTIDTVSERAQSMRGIRKTSAGKSMHLVQFSGPVRPEWYKALEETGVRVVTYIPNNAYLVYGDSAALARLQNHMSSAKAIQWDGEYPVSYTHLTLPTNREV